MNKFVVLGIFQAMTGFALFFKGIGDWEGFWIAFGLVHYIFGTLMACQQWGKEDV